MKYLKVIVIFSITLLLIAGCSKKQEEADKLEQEMLSEEIPGDTIETDSMALTEGETLDASAVPVEEEPEFVPAVVEGEGYTVQVASCESLEYAQHLVDVYTGRGYEPYLTQFDMEGQLYYRVRIGKFESESEAIALKSEIADKYSVDAWVDVL